MRLSIIPMQIFLFRFYHANSIICIALYILLYISFCILLCRFLYSLSCFLSCILLCKFYYIDFIVRIPSFALLAGFYYENLLYKINYVDYNCRILLTSIAIFCHADSVVKSFILLCSSIVQILLYRSYQANFVVCPIVQIFLYRFCHMQSIMQIIV